MKNPRNDVFELMVSINKEGWGLLLRGRGFQISDFKLRYFNFNFLNLSGF